ncbi:MAG TPA: carbon starvation protein A [Verrucomicrobia bacterium]|nr:MAG: hypothetical protein A2X46_17010 [Lentisphaerae bacterium GWF2_57_35]HBA86131.1 carbon starvation protein A [Verrucomicrobiota bacterium]
MLALLFIVCCVILGLGYVFYGRFIERRLDVHDGRTTPAHIVCDGVDYVPTANSVLFGHHFSSIAGAGPIVGPIIAGLAFGWGPALLWIVLGALFIGGTHDFTALVASIRHRARSVGELCRELLSPLAYYMFLIFIWFTLIYVLMVFLDLTALSYAPHVNPASATAQSQLRQGGAVATASMGYIVLAVLFGLCVYRFKVSVLKASLIFIPLVFAALWLGNLMPLCGERFPVLWGSPTNTWKAVLLIYCFVASVLPVWVLLQPRDYLSSFLLYSSLLAGGLGIVITGFHGTAPIQYPFFIAWSDAQLGFIFPALFVTVACGAVSGFHSIVASGTTSKQLKSESSARLIGYGSMLVEAVLAVIALATVMILSKGSSGQPVALFAQGFGRFVEILGVPPHMASTFALLAVSTFLLTTLDTCTRLSRFIFEEIFNIRGALARYIGTAATLLIPALTVFREIPGAGGVLMPVWKAIWPAFGATNQLMAALALLVVYTWLKQEGRKTVFVLIPMSFMCATSLTSLTKLTIQSLFYHGSWLVGAICLILDVLAVALIVDAFLNIRKPHPLPAQPVEFQTP